MKSSEPILSFSLLSSPLKLAHYTTRKIHHRRKLCSKKEEKKYCLEHSLYRNIIFRDDIERVCSYVSLLISWLDASACPVLVKR